jgi:hypothetical protein
MSVVLLFPPHNNSTTTITIINSTFYMTMMKKMKNQRRRRVDRLHVASTWHQRQRMAIMGTVFTPRDQSDEGKHFYKVRMYRAFPSWTIGYRPKTTRRQRPRIIMKRRMIARPNKRQRPQPLVVISTMCFPTIGGRMGNPTTWRIWPTNPPIFN